MSERQRVNQELIVRHADADVLASAVAARLAVRLLDAQAAHGAASVVLTGGRIAARIFSTLRDSPVRDTIDWSRVDIWWGDERFVPAGDPERNDVQAREALLDALTLDPARVRAMPTSDGPDGDDPDAAAARYAEALATAAGQGHGALPRFDVLMLGVGEDGHVASLFPGHPGVADSRPVAGVRGSPKPPPNRVTLTLPTINTADEVWLIASGTGKAEAVATAITGDGGDGALPAARVRGVHRTLWLLDAAAAAGLPPPSGSAG